jgi:MFS family permease
LLFVAQHWPGGRRAYDAAVERRPSLMLLAVLSVGVFLAGLELMITAVALPSIIQSFGGSTGAPAITELRRASWIINGYLLVYVVAMPLAGRLADTWGARRLFLAALFAFSVGSLLAGRAQSIEELIAGRLIQALGGGTIVPVATAAAAHLFEGHARPRALGVIGALTFLGMAAGPFAGAAILDAVHADSMLNAAGVYGRELVALLSPAWRWVFYVNLPIGIVLLAIAWAASADWDTPHHGRRIDGLGALLFSAVLGTGLVAITLLGARSVPGDSVDPLVVSAGLGIAALATGIALVARGLTAREPFVDPHLFRDRVFSSATFLSLVTGYAFATAIIGGAVFVDRVLYGGPDDQRVALGALAGATAVGALASGFLVRVLSLRAVSVAGVLLAVAALLAMSRWSSDVPLGVVAGVLALFGLGFGLTVTPRSAAAVEALGRRAFGVASATVTVARMIGMALGLAILAAYGSTTIDRLYEKVNASSDAYKQFIPAELRTRDLHDGLVVEALEGWASREAAGILDGVFLVTAALSLIAIPPALALGDRPRMLARDDTDAPDPAELTLAG